MNGECLNVLRAVCKVAGVSQQLIRDKKRFGDIAIMRAVYYDVATSQGLDSIDVAMTINRKPLWITATEKRAIPMYKDTDKYIQIRAKVIKELERMKIQQSEDKAKSLADKQERELEEQRQRHEEIRKMYYRPTKCLLYDFEYTAQENWDIYNACIEARDKMHETR
jgi:hypothetical protein